MEAGELLERAVRRLEASRAIDHWQRDRERIEAEDLLAFVLGGEEPEPDRVVPPAARRRFERLVARRARGEPLAYLKGFTVFRGLEIRVRPGVFVPRDSSEHLAGLAVRRLRGRRGPVAVDLATGAGPVALAVANEVRGAEVYGTDLSAEAVAVARANARRLGLGVRFLRGDLYRPLPRGLAGRVDVITLHPPYVGRSELRDLPLEIRRFEPVHTLTDRSPDGLGLVERAIAEGRAWLERGGWILIEVSPDRARAVAARLRRAGYRDVRSSTDPSFRVTRVVAGRLG
ncbi:MAG TPA: HemK family protein methyltransferase [Actinomycetota bacterium]|nr:HemK family protein methyltransferase [Actinomycetota bacterium]